MANLLSSDNTLTVMINTIDDKAMFSASARENPEVVIDYFPPVGTGKGYTSLELLMASFGSCVGTTLLGLIRFRLKKQADGISAEIRGAVREEHPKALSQITMKLKIRAKDLSDAETREALRVAEDSLCPVWAMLKGNVDIKVSFEIIG